MHVRDTRLAGAAGLLCLLAACADDPGTPPTPAPAPPDLQALPSFVNEWAVAGWQVAVDDDGLIHVADWNGMTVYTAGGDSVGRWCPVRDGEDLAPVYFTYAHGRFVLVTSILADNPLPWVVPRRSAVAVCDAQRRLVGVWPEQVSRNVFHGEIDALAVDASGDIYVALDATRSVVRYSAAGRFEAEWSVDGPDTLRSSAASGIAAAADGRIIVTKSSRHSILSFSRDGEFLARLGSRDVATDGHNGPCGLAFDTAGALYVADRYAARVAKMDAAGTVIGTFGPMEVGIPTSLPFLVRVHGRDVYVLCSGGTRLGYLVRRYRYAD